MSQLDDLTPDCDEYCRCTAQKSLPTGEGQREYVSQGQPYYPYYFILAFICRIVK